MERVTSLKRPSQGKLKLANSCWQTQVGVCERHINSRQTRFYLTPTVCKRVCHLFLCRSHTPTWVWQHEFAKLSLPCEGRLRIKLIKYDANIMYTDHNNTIYRIKKQHLELQYTISNKTDRV